MSVFNEYSKLKAVMVGKCYPSNITKKIWKNNTSDKIIESLCKINDETNEDLDNLQLYLEKEGIKVLKSLNSNFLVPTTEERKHVYKKFKIDYSKYSRSVDGVILKTTKNASNAT